jgi:hypothetical protein
MADNKSFAGTEVDHGSVQKDKNSVSAGVGAEAGAEASSKRGLGNGTTGEASASTGVSATAGASAEAKNGNAKFEATTRVEAGAEAKAGTSTKLIGDTTADVEVHASAKTYSEVGVSGQIGKDGVAGSAGAIAGSKVGVGTSATVGNDRNNAKMGAEVSVGPQIGAAVGGGATMDDGKLTVGADVKLALGVGARQLELAEEQIFRIFAQWQGDSWDGEIEYPRAFHIRDKNLDMDILKKASETNPANPQVKALIDNKILDILSDGEYEEEEMEHPTTTAADRTPHIQEMIMGGYTDAQILQLHSEISQADIDAAKQQLLNSNNEAASTTQAPTR